MPEEEEEEEEETHLTFPAEATEEIVALEFVLLLRDNAGHLEDEPVLRGLV